ncbi:MAG: periplasmic copper-binding protein, partial [Parcubacteria group bacterium Gr01-1014_20]
TFNGTILSAKQIIMQTGAVLNGRALAQTQVTLDGNTVSIPTTPTSIGPTHTFSQENGYFVDCGVTPTLLPGQTFGMLPMLCPYISKHPDGLPAIGNDGSLNSFHQPFTTTLNGGITWNDTPGRLAKSENDIVDNWTIDLAVPCFGGHCAQDWESFVFGINPTAVAADYVQPLANEHKVFGCDLWVEVSGVSCAQNPASFSVVSDTSNTVPENGGAAAEALTFIHSAWTASIPGATWIWENDPVENPGVNETFTFEKSFTVTGSVTNATLAIATDNTYSVYVNNTLVGGDLNENNFQLGTQDSYPVTNLVSGSNTVKVVATNIGVSGASPSGNPAGVLYKLSYDTASCVE